MKLTDKVAIVTGGGTGMGKAISQRFACEGARVIVNYSRSREAAEKVAQSIRENGGDALAFRADVGIEADARALINEAEKTWGRLDVLVNNAGWTQRVPHHQLEDLTDTIWDRTFAVNLRGPFYTMRAAAPLLRRNPGSSIINVSSTAAYYADGSSIAYSAAKFGVIAITKSLARVLAPEVRVNVLVPGTVATGFAGWPPEFYETIAKQSPLRRNAGTEEFAAAALFLAADATFMTGEQIVVDCGLLSLRKA
jgi:3-oxoacyl-[acyl-carrier protein] reductase